MFTLLVLPFEGLRRLLEWLAGDMQPEPQEPQPPPERPEQDDDQPAWLRALGIALTASFVALLALAALAIVWAVFRRIRREGSGPGADRRERVEGSSLFGDLADIVASLSSRLARRTPQSAVPIRRLYFDVLRDAQADGLERPRAATPGGFAIALDRHYGTDTPSRIAAAFERSRYGGYVVPHAEVDALRRAWRLTGRPVEGGPHPE